MIADIYLGKITKWNDARIAKDNPGVKLPDHQILPVYRSDGSGTNYIFTDYLSKVSPEFKQKVGSATSVEWPLGVGQKGNEGVAGMIRNSPYSFGYVELIYAVQNHMLYGLVKNADGQVDQGVDGNGERGGGGSGEEHAGRLPGVDHECSGSECVSDLVVHLAADSGPLEGRRPRARCCMTSWSGCWIMARLRLRA